MGACRQVQGVHITPPLDSE